MNTEHWKSCPDLSHKFLSESSMRFTQAWRQEACRDMKLARLLPCEATRLRQHATSRWDQQWTTVNTLAPCWTAAIRACGPCLSGRRPRLVEAQAGRAAGTPRHQGRGKQRGCSQRIPVSGSTPFLCEPYPRAADACMQHCAHYTHPCENFHDQLGMKTHCDAFATRNPVRTDLWRHHSCRFNLSGGNACHAKISVQK